MNGKRATVRDMRRRNRSVLLTSIYLDGPLSRYELTVTTGLSAASVSNLVGEMIDDGLVEEAGSVDSDGGRPRSLLRVRPSYAHVVGVDVGETGVQVELFDLALTALAKADYPIDAARPDPATVVRHILAGIEATAQAAGVPAQRLLGVGVGVPGVVQQTPEVLVHAQANGWDAVPLHSMLRGGTEAPIYIHNGAQTMGQAEVWFGAGRGARHAVIALLGSGIGAAVMTNGASYRGASSSAGEWGHTVISFDGRPCRCGSKGCLEAYVGAESILDRWREASGGPVPGDDEASSLNALLAAAPTSDAAARVLRETAGYLGAGIANLVNLFNPERILLGGWAGLALGERLLPEIRAAVAAHALRQPYAETTITLCRLGPDAVAVGAATLPIAHLLENGGLPTVPAPRAPDTFRPAAFRA